MSQLAWRLDVPLGFSAVLLDQNVYRQMVALDSVLGVRVEGLPIQVCVLVCSYNGDGDSIFQHKNVYY